jgi:hypothetical protein
MNNNQQLVTIFLKDQKDPIILQGFVQHLTTGVLQVTVEQTQQQGFLASLSSNTVYGFPVHNIAKYEIAAANSYNTTFKVT